VGGGGTGAPCLRSGSGSRSVNDVHLDGRDAGDRLCGFAGVAHERGRVFARQDEPERDVPGVVDDKVLDHLRRD
jgi:hypothetical protein